MPESKKLFIAYCKENKDIADEIQQELNKVDYQFNPINDQSIDADDCIYDTLSKQTGPGLLLISDNFLKSESCMKDMLSFIENPVLSKDIQIVVIDGKYLAEDGHSYEKVETTFDRVSNVIKYMNYWQEKYLEMRKIKRTLTSEEEENPFNKKLAVVKSISAQIGDFLRILRTKECWSFEILSANDYNFFFKKYGTPSLYASYQELVKKDVIKTAVPEDSFELEQDLSQLPGIDLLTKAEHQGMPPIVEEKVAAVENVTEKVLTEEDAPKAGTKSSIESSFSNPAENSFEIENIVEEIAEEDAFENDKAVKSDIKDSYRELQAVYDDEEEKDIIEDITEDFDLQVDTAPELVSGPKEPNEIDTPADKQIDEEEGQSDDPNQILHEASNLIEAGEIEKALLLLDNTIQNHPDNSKARFLQAGLILAYRKDVEAAQNQLLKVVELEPSNYEAFQCLAELAESKHDYPLAKNYYENVIELAPNTPGVYYKLGLITSGFFKEKYKLAAQYFEKAIEENKKNVDARYRLGVLYNEHLDKSGKAIKHFKRVLKLQAQHPFANYDLALLYHSLDDPHNAAFFYQKACASNPEIKTAENDQVFKLDQFAKPGGSSFEKQEKKSKKKGKKVKVPKFVKKIEKNATEKRIIPDDDLTPEIKQGKVVFITGATSGIGKACAQKFAENGYRLILNGRRTDRLKELLSTFKKQYNTEHRILPFDVRDIESVKLAINELEDEWRQVDILINNAGLAKGYAPIHEGQLEHWEAMIDTNVKGLLYLTRIIAPFMVKRQSGHIINVCSSAGHEVYPNGNVYCATKYAVDAITKSMRIDLHKYNIRVGQVSPGHVEETEFAFVRYEDEEKAKIFEDFQPLKSKDVAEAIYYMATAPEHVNIQDIQLMGTQQASNNYIDRSGR